MIVAVRKHDINFHQYEQMKDSCHTHHIMGNYLLFELLWENEIINFKRFNLKHVVVEE